MVVSHIWLMYDSHEAPVHNSNMWSWEPLVCDSHTLTNDSHTAPIHSYNMVGSLTYGSCMTQAQFSCTSHQSFICHSLILLHVFEKQISYIIFTLPTKETQGESNRHILPFRCFQKNISVFLSDNFWSIIQGFSVYIE